MSWREKIEDTFCEAFDGFFIRICITAENDHLLRTAVNNSTALPCTVFGESEGGLDTWLSEDKTPDGRKGAVIQLWINEKQSIDKFEFEISKRIRQGILVVPTTAVFDALDTSSRIGRIETMRRIGHCGDGYETIEKRYGREMISIPIMMGEFLIDRHLSYGKGVMGGNVWFMCADLKSALEAGNRAVEEIEKVEGAITPFGICSAGSKPETRFPEIGPTTNHPYCPKLRDRISDSKVPEGVSSIPEIVINGISLDAVKKAMTAAIESAKDIEGVLRISAGNYGGKLGKYYIHLKDLI